MLFARDAVQRDENRDMTDGKNKKQAYRMFQNYRWSLVTDSMLLFVANTIVSFFKVLNFLTNNIETFHSVLRCLLASLLIMAINLICDITSGFNFAFQVRQYSARVVFEQNYQAPRSSLDRTIGASLLFVVFTIFGLSHLWLKLVLYFSKFSHNHAHVMVYLVNKYLTALDTLCVIPLDHLTFRDLPCFSSLQMKRSCFPLFSLVCALLALALQFDSF